MKKIIFIFLVLFSVNSFAEVYPTPNASCSGVVGNISPLPNIACAAGDTSCINSYKSYINGFACPAGSSKTILGTDAVCMSTCSCPSGFERYSDMTSGTPQQKCRAKACTPPLKINVVMSGGVYTASCVEDTPSQTQSSAASSSSSSSLAACPAGQNRDGNGTCNTKCTAPNVYNPIANACEMPASCTYPQLYNANFNACNSNPENCAIGTTKDLINGGCMAYNQTSCPTGFQLTSDALHCTPAAQTTSSTASGSAASAAASSTPSSATPVSSAAAQTSKPSIPITTNDDTSPTQSTTQSASIPAGISNSACNQLYSSTACTVVQNCQLTFGVNNCIGITSGQNCPNTYIVNGQKMCVLSSGSNSSSGSNTSGSGSNTSQKGECDPTAKNYDECMGRHTVPTDSETKKVTDDIKAASDKALDDYAKAVKDDLDAFSNSGGVSFRSAADGLKSAVYSHIPQPQTCQNIEFKYLGTTKNLDCSKFEMFKVILAWFLSLTTIIYIFKLAVKPVGA